jgi:hypothetical protein
MKRGKMGELLTVWREVVVGYAVYEVRDEGGK